MNTTNIIKTVLPNNLGSVGTIAVAIWAALQTQSGVAFAVGFGLIIWIMVRLVIK